MEGRIKHDLQDLEHWSIWMDLKTVFLSAPGVLIP
jgi:lipopolysaccharide/colanic/teichoic acid biosynthesis glycosyltransferase